MIIVGLFNILKIIDRLYNNFMMIDMNWTFGFFKSEIIENFYDYWLIIHSLLVIIQNLGRKKKGVTKIFFLLIFDLTYVFYIQKKWPHRPFVCQSAP